MIAIIDYGVGNLFSLKSSFAYINQDAVVTGDKKVIDDADKIILPGVGAFCDAAEKLSIGGLDDFIREQAKKGKYIMGICLGMQLLFNKSFEYGEYAGLSLIKGDVCPISDVIPDGLKIPHMGWNALDFKGEAHPIFKNIHEKDYVYFVHSYYATKCDESTIATCDYGYPLTAAVAKDNVIGCQFHPEKSGDVGLNILKAFCELEG
ncbi:MAG: imidazole glycerol phosphate synthase subunit HisH [Clostridiales bacterium]|nr:imidazole glycerol phosphate synthase subunit HisH [Clostridiales bacterium]